MRRPSLYILPAILLGAGLVTACWTSTGDDSMYLTGTEEYAVTNANGVVSCTNPKKVLICHIPPGNPDNAHDICVSTHAVEPHQTHHGDTVGACDPQPPSGDDAGTPPPSGDDAGTQEPPPPGDGGIVL